MPSAWEKFNLIATRGLRLVYINFLWILFSLIGLVLFTVFPATAAMYFTTKKVMIDKSEIKIFKTFWQYFCSEFIKSNGFGLIFLIIGYFLYADYIILTIYPKLQFFAALLFLLVMITILTFLFFFPVYTYYQLKFFHYFKQTLLIVITSPLEVILLILMMLLMYIVGLMLPGAIILFAGSGFAYFSLLICIRAFKRIEAKKEMQENSH